MEKVDSNGQMVGTTKADGKMAINIAKASTIKTKTT